MRFGVCEVFSLGFFLPSGSLDPAPNLINSTVNILWRVLQYVLRCLLFAPMESTLTIRLSAKQREALKRRAAAEKRSESALVRDLINRELRRGFEFDHVRHLVGSIASAPKHWESDPWRKRIRQRSWR